MFWTGCYQVFCHFPNIDLGIQCPVSQVQSQDCFGLMLQMLRSDEASQEVDEDFELLVMQLMDESLTSLKCKQSSMDISMSICCLGKKALALHTEKNSPERP